MIKLFQQLRPLEQRLVIGTGILLFVLANWIWVVPHFGDWKKVQSDIASTRTKIIDYKKEIADTPMWENKRKSLEDAGSALPSESMAVGLQRSVDSQAASSGLVQISSSPGTPSQEPGSFFEERSLNLNYQAGDKEMVDFLYNIGADKSLIRVRDIVIKPDPGLTRLQGSMTLVASYQKAAAAVAKSAPGGAKTSNTVSGAKSPTVPKATTPGTPKAGGGPSNNVPGGVPIPKRDPSKSKM